MKDIYNGLKSLIIRIRINKAMRLIAYALIGAGIVSFVISFTALFIVIPFLTIKILYTYTLSVLAVLVVSIFIKPKIQSVIKIADSLGLKERLVTAYQLKDDDSLIAKAQRDDAFNAVKDTDFKLLFPIKIPYLRLVTSIVLVGLVFVLNIIPTPAKDKAFNSENIIKETKKQTEMLKKEIKKVNKDSKISKEKLKELNKKVDELLNELKKAKNEEDALKALSKADHEIDKLSNSFKEQALNKLSKALGKNQLTKELDEAFKDGSKEKIDKAKNEFMEKLKKANEKDKDELQKELKKASNDAEDEEIKKSLNNLAAAVKSGNSSSQKSSLKALEDAVSKNSSNGSSTGKSFVNMKQALNEAKYQISKKSGSNLSFSQNSGQTSDQSGSSGDASDSEGNQQSGDGQGAQGDQGDQGNQGSGASQGGSQEGSQGGQSGAGAQGNGQGKQSGSGQGNGKSQGGGGGAGSGTTNKDGGYSGTESSGGSRKPGDKKLVDYEKIYVPERLGGDSKISQVKGQKGNSGQSQFTDVDGVPVEKGEAIPYNEVLQEYQDEAISSLNDSPIPPGMKDIVREYFSTLE